MGLKLFYEAVYCYFRNPIWDKCWENELDIGEVGVTSWRGVRGGEDRYNKIACKAGTKYGRASNERLYAGEQ